MATEIISSISNQLIPTLIILCIFIIIVGIVLNKTIFNPLGLRDFVNALIKKVNKGRSSKLSDLKRQIEEYKEFRSEMELKLKDLSKIFGGMEEESKKVAEIIEKSDELIKQIGEREQIQPKNIFRKFFNKVKINKLSNDLEKYKCNIEKSEKRINSEKENMKEKINEMSALFKK